MKYVDLQNKTPKQLRDFIYRIGWNKKLLLDEMEYAGEEPRDYYKEYTLLELCDTFTDVVVDLIWEEMCNAQ